VVGVTVGETTYRARIVVGADGRHSTIAELTGAKEIVGYDSPRFGYWGYWPVTAAWRNSERHFDAFLHFGMPNDQILRFIFQTDGDLLLIGATPLLSDLPKWKGRHEAAYLEALAACPITAPLIAGNTRQGDLLGLLKARYYMREAVGPGYALVGDSGLHKDPAPGWGITDALRDARQLAIAILDGSEAALLRYAKQRNLDSIELFHFASDFGGTAYRNPLNRVALDHLRHSPALISRLGAVLDREVSPYEAVPALKVLQWTLAALARGNGSVLGSFFTSARRTLQVRRARDICARELQSLTP
jgi:menaquinone-9 beta-reductase